MLLDPLLNTSEVAAIFRVRPRTVRHWCAQGKLVAIRVGRELLFSRERIERVAQAERPSGASADERPAA